MKGNKSQHSCQTILFIVRLLFYYQYRISLTLILLFNQVWFHILYFDYISWAFFFFSFLQYTLKQAYFKMFSKNNFKVNILNYFNWASYAFTLFVRLASFDSLSNVLHIYAEFQDNFSILLTSPLVFLCTLLSMNANLFCSFVLIISKKRLFSKIYYFDTCAISLLPQRPKVCRY